jgi:hypothetical protein
MNDRIEIGAWASVGDSRGELGSYQNRGELGFETYATGDVLLGMFGDEDAVIRALEDYRESRSNGGMPHASEKPDQGPLAPASNKPAPSKPGLSPKEFLQLVVPWGGAGYFSVHWQHPEKDGFHGRSFQNIDAALQLITQLKAGAPANIYFCLSRHNGKRSRANALALQAVWMDIDVDPADDKKYSTVAEAIVSLFWFCDQLGIPRPSFIVASGGGVHAYWISRRALAANEWQLFANTLKAVAKNSKLKLDAGVTGDVARVLRVPGTTNWKYDDGPRPVHLLPKYCTGVQHNFAAAFGKILSENASGRPKIAEAFKGRELKNLGEGIVIDEIPLQPFKPIKAECGWLRTAYETGGEQYDNPQWNLTALCATFIENGRKLAHLLSNKYPKYTVAETDEKFDIKLRERQNNPKLGWPKCKAIQDAGSKHCATCPHLAAGKTPLHLALKLDNGLPVLDIGHEPTAVAKDLAKLIAQGEHYFFNGNAPVRVAVEINNMPRAIEVTPENVRVLAHEICNPVKRTKQGLLPAEIKTDVANIYLKGLEGRWGLKHFAGIATTPILSGDGTIRSMDGYDPLTGLWCHNIPALNIPENPTGREAAAALLRIRHAFRTFAFADTVRMQDRELGVEVVDLRSPAGLDESSAIAATLTAACRPSLQTAPGFLCNAPALSGAGTGKGLLVKAICIIASGASPHAFTSGHDASELDKRLTAALIQARPAIFLDNFNAKELTSDTLASALTENPAQVRIFGQTKMVPLHVCTFIGITGCGIQIAEDMARRLLETRLDAMMENPEERNFKPGFLDDIFAQRPSLLSDLLTIWRWGRQNSNVLDVGRPFGSYEIWARWVRDPLLTLGLRDPVERTSETKANDPRRRALIELFDLWYKKHKNKPVKATQLDWAAIRLIDGSARIDFDGSFKYNRQKVAGFLTQRAGTYVGGYRLIQSKEGPQSKENAVYTLVRSAQP